MKHDDEMTKELASELADYVADCLDDISIAEYSRTSLISITENYLRGYAEHMHPVLVDKRARDVRILDLLAKNYVLTERIAELEQQLEDWKITPKKPSGITSGDPAKSDAYPKITGVLGEK